MKKINARMSMLPIGTQFKRYNDVETIYTILEKQDDKVAFTRHSPSGITYVEAVQGIADEDIVVDDITYDRLVKRYLY